MSEQEIVIDAPEVEAAEVATTEEEGAVDSLAEEWAKLTPEEAVQRGLKAEKTLISSKRAPSKPVTNTPPPDQGDIPDWGKTLLQTEGKRQFGHSLNLSPETVDAVFKFNGGTMPTEEMMQSDPAIKAIVKDFEGRRRVSANTPKGGTMPIYKGKTYTEVVTDKSASPADKQAAFVAAGKRRGL